MKFSLVFLLTLLATACVPTSPTPPSVPTPEPIRAITATPLPFGNHPIYILDTRNGDLLSRILVVDPGAQRVVRTIAARYDPEIAISPDGQRLYVADAYSTQVIRGEPRDVLSVYDLSKFELLRDEVDLAKRLQYKVFPMGQPWMFLSQDGRRLFVGKYGDPDIHALRLAVFETQTFKMLAEYEHPDCTLLPLRDGRLACVSGFVQLLDPLTGKPTRSISLGTSIAESVVSASGERLYLVSPYAQIVVVDVAGYEPKIIASRNLLGNQDKWQIGSNHIALSRDETRLYVGILSGENAYRNLADEIVAFDTRNWNRVGAFEPSDPAFHIAISADNSQLYTVNPFKKSLTIFDTATFREIAVMRAFGDTPARITVPLRP